jgi:hypothetical protein
MDIPYKPFPERNVYIIPDLPIVDMPICRMGGEYEKYSDWSNSDLCWYHHKQFIENPLDLSFLKNRLPDLKEYCCKPSYNFMKKEFFRGKI